MATVEQWIKEQAKTGAKPEELAAYLRSLNVTAEDRLKPIEPFLVQTQQTTPETTAPTQQDIEGFQKQQQQLQQAQQLLRQQQRAVPVERMAPIQRAVVTKPSAVEKGAEQILAAKAGADRKKIIQIGKQQVALTQLEARQALPRLEERIGQLVAMSEDAKKRGTEIPGLAERIQTMQGAVDQIKTTFIEPEKDTVEEMKQLAFRAPGVAQGLFAAGAAVGGVKALPVIAKEELGILKKMFVPKPLLPKKQEEKDKLPSQLMLDEAYKKWKTQGLFESAGSDLLSLGRMFFDIGKGFAGISPQGPFRSGAEIGEGVVTAPFSMVSAYGDSPVAMLRAYPATTLLMLAPFKKGLGKGLKSRAAMRRAAFETMSETGMAPKPSFAGNLLARTYQTVGEVLDPVPVALNEMAPARQAAYTQKLKTQHQANVRNAIKEMQQKGEISAEAATKALEELSAMDLRLSTETPGGIPPEFLVDTNAAKLGRALQGSFFGAALMGDFLSPLLGVTGGQVLGATLGGPGLAGLKAYGPKLAGTLFPLAASKFSKLVDVYKRELVDPSLVQPRTAAVIDEPAMMREQARATGTTIGAELRQRPGQPVAPEGVVRTTERPFVASLEQGVTAKPTAMSRAFELGQEAVEAARKADIVKSELRVEKDRLKTEGVAEPNIARPTRPVYPEDIRSQRKQLVNAFRQEMAETNFGSEFFYERQMRGPKGIGETKGSRSFEEIAKDLPGVTAKSIRQLFIKELHKHVVNEARRITLGEQQGVFLRQGVNDKPWLEVYETERMAKDITNALIREVKTKRFPLKFGRNQRKKLFNVVFNDITDALNSVQTKRLVESHGARLLEAMEQKSAKRAQAVPQKVVRAKQRFDKFSNEFVSDMSQRLAENPNVSSIEWNFASLSEPYKTALEQSKYSLTQKLIAAGVSEEAVGPIVDGIAKRLGKRIELETKNILAQRARAEAPRTAEQIAQAAGLEYPTEIPVFRFEDPVMSRLVNDFAESVELLGLDKGRVQQMFADTYHNETSVGLLLDERMRGAFTKRLVQELVPEQRTYQFNRPQLAEQLTRFGLNPESALAKAAQAIDSKMARKILREQIDTFVRERVLTEFVGGKFTQFTISGKPISKIISDTYKDFADNPKIQQQFKSGAVEALRENLVNKMQQEASQQAFVQELKRSVDREGYDPATEKQIDYRGVAKSIALEFLGEEPLAVVVDQAFVDTPNLFSDAKVVDTITEVANKEIQAIRPESKPITVEQVRLKLAKLASYEPPSNILKETIGSKSNIPSEIVRVDPNYNSAVSAHFENLQILNSPNALQALFRHSKRALTTLSAKTILGNIYSNIYLQSLMYGQTPARTMVGYTNAMRLLNNYKKGDLPPDAMMMMRAIEGSGVVNSSAIADLTTSMKGTPVGGWLASKYRAGMTKAGGFYQLGDAVPKLYNTMRTMQEMVKAFESVEPGRDVTLMPSRGRYINMRKNADGSWTVFQRGSSQKISSSSQQYYNLLADTAARTARETLVDFNKTPTALKRLQSKASFLTPVSMFFTWAHQTMELPGKPGIFSGALNFEPLGHVRTNSPKLLQAQSLGLLKTASKRASLNALARYYDAKRQDPDSRVYRIMSGYGSQGAPMVQTRTGEDTFGVSNPINANPFSSLATQLRLGRGLFYQAFGKDAARRASAKPPEERTDYDKQMLRLEQSRLAGQLNPLKDAAMLAGLAHPAFDGINKQLQRGDDVSLASATEAMGNFLAGTTISGSARLLYDKLSGNVLRRAKIVQERGEKIEGRFENLTDYAIYQIFKEGLRETNIAKDGKEWIKRQRNQYKFPAASRLKELQQISPSQRDNKQNEGLIETAKDKIEFMRHRLAMFGGNASSFKFPLEVEYRFLKKKTKRKKGPITQEDLNKLTMPDKQKDYYSELLKVYDQWLVARQKLFPGKKPSPVKGLFQEDLDAYLQGLKASPKLKKPVFSRQ